MVAPVSAGHRWSRFISRPVRLSTSSQFCRSASGHGGQLELLPCETRVKGGHLQARMFTFQIDPIIPVPHPARLSSLGCQGWCTTVLPQTERWFLSNRDVTPRPCAVTSEYCQEEPTNRNCMVVLSHWIFGQLVLSVVHRTVLISFDCAPALLFNWT